MRRLILLAILLSYPAALCGLFVLSKTLPTRIWQRTAQVITSIVLLYPVAVLLISGIQLLFPQRSGVLALSQALAPHLFLPLLLLLPLAFVRRARLLRWVLLVSLVVFCIRFIPPLHWSRPAPDPRQLQLTVLNWNTAISMETAQQARVRPLLASRPADVVVLQEAYWEWLRQDPLISRLYPYQVNHTPEASSGLVVLSAYPIREWAGAERRQGVRGWPRLVWARIEVAGRQVLLVAAHPESPYSRMGACQRPPCYDTTERDTLLPAIRAVIDPALQRGEPVLLVGDLNVTEREPSYADLATGLRDAQREVGRGAGNTWGLIAELPWWRFPLLRIDYMFSSPNIRPLDLSTDCTPRGSDHCALRGIFEIGARS